MPLEDFRLEFRFPEVHSEARCFIEFQCTLRMPDDGRDYRLPPGLGQFPLFPLRYLNEHAANLPETWRTRDGIIAPMCEPEGLWISLVLSYPFAVRVGTGKICAITADPWVNRLTPDPQDYAVRPEQPRLDGYCVGKGVVSPVRCHATRRSLLC